MGFTLSEDQKALQGEIARFAEKELNEGAVDRDRDQVFSRELWEKCGAMGLQGLPVSTHYGGSDAVKEKYFPGLCDGTLVAVNAMTETSSGSEAFAMASRATPSRRRLRFFSLAGGTLSQFATGLLFPAHCLG